MRKLITSAVLGAIALFVAQPATAGLTVSLIVNDQSVGLIPLAPNSGTPDNNQPHQNGFVAVAALAVNLDDHWLPDLFIDSLTVYSNKSAAEGVLSTINFAARLLGAGDVKVAIEVFDDFLLPVSSVGSPLEITSAFNYVNPDLDSKITLVSELSAMGEESGVSTSPLTVDAESDVPVSQTATLVTPSVPFNLKSKYDFHIGGNSIVSFKAETTAVAAANTAHAPEPASLIAWGSMLAIAGLVYGWRRKRHA